MGSLSPLAPFQRNMLAARTGWILDASSQNLNFLISENNGKHEPSNPSLCDHSSFQNHISEEC